MTPAEARALDAINQGEVRLSRRGLYWHAPEGISGRTLSRLLEEGLLLLAHPREVADLEYIEVGLSDPGRAELEAIVHV